MGMAAQYWECIKCHQTEHIKMVKTVHFTLCVFYHNKNESAEKRESPMLGASGPSGHGKISVLVVV